MHMKSLLPLLAKGRLAAFAIFFLLPFITYSQSKFFDHSFGKDGVVKTNVLLSSTVFKLVPARNGKIMAFGAAWDGTKNKLAIARYTKDGKLDSSFGINGIVLQEVPTQLNWDILAATTGPDYSLLVGGYTLDSSINTYPLLYRFTENGTPDTGHFAMVKLYTTYRSVLDVRVKPGNKTVVVFAGRDDSIRVAQFNADGTPDNSFGNQQTVTTHLPVSGFAYLDLLPDNSVLVADIYSTPAGQYGNVITKLKDNGTPDSSFGQNGIADLLNGLAVRRIIHDGSGRLLLGGDYVPTDGSPEKIGVERLRPDGHVDTTFGINGLAWHSYIPSGAALEDNVINDIGIDENDHIYLAGRNHPVKGKSNFLIVRCKGDGGLDNTFGNNGIISDPVDSTYSVGATLLVQPGGKPIVSGSSALKPITIFTLVRYLTTSALPIELLNFTAGRVEKGILLKWNVASQPNLDYFEIQHSATAGNFTAIGRADAGQTAYNWVDTRYNTGSNFYRLKIIDKDHHYTYSDIKLVNIVPAVKLLVYPNPAIDNLVVDGLNNEAFIQIINAAGKTVANIHATGNSYIFNMTTLANGMYWVKVSTGGRHQTFTVVKQR